MIQAVVIDKVIGALLKIGAVGFAYWLLTKGKRDKEKKEEEKQQKESDTRVTTGPEVGQAIALRAGMNPSGVSWLMATDGTKVEDIMKIATEIKDLDKVVTEYGAQYPKERLLEDLNKELGPETLNRFLSIAKGTNNAYANYSTIKTGIAVNNTVKTKVNSFVRTSPKKEYNYISSDNIITTVPAGKVIGYTTGQTAYDEESDVIFIEVRTYKDGQQFKFWVAKSNVELIPHEDYKKRLASGEKFPFFSFVSLSGVNQFPQIIVTARIPVSIYSPHGVNTGNASANMPLGIFIYRFTIGNKTAIVFETMQGHKRLADADKVQLTKVIRS